MFLKPPQLRGGGIPERDLQAVEDQPEQEAVCLPVEGRDADKTEGREEGHGGGEKKVRSCPDSSSNRYNPWSLQVPSHLQGEQAVQGDGGGPGENDRVPALCDDKSEEWY